MDGAKFAVGDVGVDLSCRDVGVAEEKLDGAEVGAVTEEVSGETMAKGVRRDRFHNAGGDSIMFDEALDTARGQPHFLMINKQGLAHVWALI